MKMKRCLSNSSWSDEEIISEDNDLLKYQNCFNVNITGSCYISYLNWIIFYSKGIDYLYGIER